MERFLQAYLHRRAGRPRSDALCSSFMNWIDDDLD
jgi:hypothetical protein